MKKNMLGVSALAFMVSVCLGGCSGGGNGSAPGGGNSVVTAVRMAAPLDVCPTGGIQVDSGIDSNGNGALDAQEITSSQYVCDGENGSDGLPVLVLVTDEPAGDNCIGGGKRIDVGKDGNENGVLDPAETASTDYLCHGSPGTGGIAWMNVAGTSAQAEPNRGYLANGSSMVTITLPASLAVGDIVRVSGVGTGGWTIAQNPGQSILTWGLASWTQHGPARYWQAVASSSDGTRIVAVENSGLIYTSEDSGETWTERDQVRSWQGVASSSDGSRLVAVENGGFIYTSDNYGATWIQREQNQNRNWQAVASSSTGSNLVAADYQGKLYTSVDSGATWTAREQNRTWQAVASSADGVRLVAVVNEGYIYTSGDSGETWEPRMTDAARKWKSVATSADGKNLVAAEFQGYLYTSPDFGETWTPCTISGWWQSVASSADGTRLVAVDNAPGEIYVSLDAGKTWKPQGGWRGWKDAAVSGDGNRLVAVDGAPGSLYTFRGRTTAGTSGSLGGGQYDAVELQFVGDDDFAILSHSGSLIVR